MKCDILKPALRLLSLDKQNCYSQSGRSLPCNFRDYSKIDFQDLITIPILLSCLLLFYSNIAAVGQSIVDYNRKLFIECRRETNEKLMCYTIEGILVDFQK